MESNADAEESTKNNEMATSYMEAIGRANQQNNNEPGFSFELPPEVLEKRKKVWGSFFDKYATEDPDDVELNAQTMEPVLEMDDNSTCENNEIDKEYYAKCKAPVRKLPALIQYWVDTGNPPYQLLGNDDHSEVGSSLSEYEGTRSDRLAIVTNEDCNDNKECSVHSPCSSVDTAAYILSNTNVTKKQDTIAIVEGGRDATLANQMETQEKNVSNLATNLNFTKTLEKSPGRAKIISAPESAQPTNIHRSTNESPMNRNSVKLSEVLPALQQFDELLEKSNSLDSSVSSPLALIRPRRKCRRDSTTPSAAKIPSVQETDGITTRKTINNSLGKPIRSRKLYSSRSSPVDLVIAKTNIETAGILGESSHPALEAIAEEASLVRVFVKPKSKRNRLSRRQSAGEKFRNQRKSLRKSSQSQDNNQSNTDERHAEFFKSLGLVPCTPVTSRPDNAAGKNRKRRAKSRNLMNSQTSVESSIDDSQASANLNMVSSNENPSRHESLENGVPCVENNVSHDPKIIPTAQQNNEIELLLNMSPDSDSSTILIFSCNNANNNSLYSESCCSTQMDDSVQTSESQENIAPAVEAMQMPLKTLGPPNNESSEQIGITKTTKSLEEPPEIHSDRSSIQEKTKNLHVRKNISDNVHTRQLPTELEVGIREETLQSDNTKSSNESESRVVIRVNSNAERVSKTSANKRVPAITESLDKPETDVLEENDSDPEICSDRSSIREKTENLHVRKNISDNVHTRQLPATLEVGIREETLQSDNTKSSNESESRPLRVNSNAERVSKTSANNVVPAITESLDKPKTDVLEENDVLEKSNEISKSSNTEKSKTFRYNFLLDEEEDDFGKLVLKIGSNRGRRTRDTQKDEAVKNARDQKLEGTAVVKLLNLRHCSFFEVASSSDEEESPEKSTKRASGNRGKTKGNKKSLRSNSKRNERDVIDNLTKDTSSKHDKIVEKQIDQFKRETRTSRILRSKMTNSEREIKRKVSPRVKMNEKIILQSPSNDLTSRMSLYSPKSSRKTDAKSESSPQMLSRTGNQPNNRRTFRFQTVIDSDSNSDIFEQSPERKIKNHLSSPLENPIMSNTEKKTETSFRDFDNKVKSNETNIPKSKLPKSDEQFARKRTKSAVVRLSNFLYRNVAEVASSSDEEEPPKKSPKRASGNRGKTKHNNKTLRSNLEQKERDVIENLAKDLSSKNDEIIEKQIEQFNCKTRTSKIPKSEMPNAKREITADKRRISSRKKIDEKIVVQSPCNDLTSKMSRFSRESRFIVRKSEDRRKTNRKTKSSPQLLSDTGKQLNNGRTSRFQGVIDSDSDSDLFEQSPNERKIKNRISSPLKNLKTTETEEKTETSSRDFGIKVKSNETSIPESKSLKSDEQFTRKRKRKSHSNTQISKEKSRTMKIPAIPIEYESDEDDKLFGNKPLIRRTNGHFHDEHFDKVNHNGYKIDSEKKTFNVSNNFFSDILENIDDEIDLSFIHSTNKKSPNNRSTSEIKKLDNTPRNNKKIVDTKRLTFHTKYFSDSDDDDPLQHF